MSLTIPVFFFAVDPADVPHQLTDWQDVVNLLNGILEAHPPGQLCISHSQNWRHQHLLSLISEAYHLPGLIFTAQEQACLHAPEMQAALADFERLFALLVTGQTLHLPNAEAYADILGELGTACQAARVQAAIDEAYGSPRQQAVTFCAFLITFQAVIEQALRSGRCLLYVMPEYNISSGRIDIL